MDIFSNWFYFYSAMVEGSWPFMKLREDFSPDEVFDLREYSITNHFPALNFIHTVNVHLEKWLQVLSDLAIFTFNVVNALLDDINLCVIVPFQVDWLGLKGKDP